MKFNIEVNIFRDGYGEWDMDFSKQFEFDTDNESCPMSMSFDVMKQFEEYATKEMLMPLYEIEHDNTIVFDILAHSKDDDGTIRSSVSSLCTEITEMERTLYHCLGWLCADLLLRLYKKEK